MLIHSPIIAFTILLLVILTVPPVFEKLRLPGLVGLLVAGVLLGENGLKLLDSKSETIKLLSDIGKVYLMFVAGLEIDLEQFRKTKNRSIGFGLFTFFIPLIAGIGVGRLFDFDWNPAKKSHETKLNPIAIIDTSMGPMFLELFKEEMPITTENFIDLANSNFFNNISI